VHHIDFVAFCTHTVVIWEAALIILLYVKGSISVVLIMASVLRPEQKLPVREGYSSIAQQRWTRARWAHTNFRPYSLSIDGQLEVLLLSNFPEAKVSMLKQA
jgi:hypothetical protein